MTTPLRIAVLASGRGSNLAALIAARDAGGLPVEFSLVGSDRAAANALQLAEQSGIATLALRPRDYASRLAFDLDLFGRVADSGAELLILAGFMRIIEAQALQPWIGQMINIHPSLLPKYPGLHTHRRALEAGDTEHGASVHYVTAELDGGPVIAQVRMPIGPADDEQQLAQRLLPLEHRLMIAVVEAMAARRLALVDDAVACDGIRLQQPLQLLGDRLSR